MLSIIAVFAFATLPVSTPINVDQKAPQLEIRADAEVIKAHLTAVSDMDTLGIVLLSGSSTTKPWAASKDLLLADFVVMGWGAMQNGALDLAVYTGKNSLPAGSTFFGQGVTLSGGLFQFGNVEMFTVGG